MERARAWDDELDRVRREAMSAELVEISKRQANQAMATAQVLTMAPVALLKKMRRSPEEVEEALLELPVADLIKMTVSCAMFLPQVQAAEREARGLSPEAHTILQNTAGAAKPDSKAPTAGAASGPTATVAGAEFIWVQSACTCSHPHSEHDQEDPDPSIVPCKHDGCECGKFQGQAQDQSNEE